jgi:hypothetical protein
MPKVLKKEDFQEEETVAEDTSTQEIPSDAMIGEDGKVVEQEPEAEKKEGGEEPQPKPSEKKEYKYKSIEDYDKAYKEAERKMHEATTRAANLEKEVTQYRKPEPKTPTIDDKIVEITDEAIKAIGALPIQYDAEGKPTTESLTKRDRDSAIIWAKAQRTISRLEIDEREKETSNWRSTVSKLTKKAKDEGLASDDEMDMVAVAFDRLSDIGSLEDRISQAVEVTKSRLSRLREGFTRRQVQDKDEKDSLKVLGRGSSRKEGDKTSGSDKPATMTDALRQSKESRRVKREDLKF